MMNLISDNGNRFGHMILLKMKPELLKHRLFGVFAYCEK